MNKFYGQFSPKQDEYLYNNFFKNCYNGVSIEAGASNGVLENNTKFFEDTLNWTTINIEPLPQWFNELMINRPNSININCALHPSENNSTANFYVPKIGKYNYKNHLGSLSKQNLSKYNTHIINIQAKTITYNTIIEKYNITKLDLFILDIEGFEAEFLKTFDEWIIYPKIFVIEIGHIDENIINSIIEHKYNLYGKHFVNNIYILK